MGEVVMSANCRHEHDEFRDGRYTGMVVFCATPAADGGRFCVDHGRMCGCGEQFEACPECTACEEDTECQDCRLETARIRELLTRTPEAAE